jgi:cell fate regulator YaaT (PSP1 superfamily)
MTHLIEVAFGGNRKAFYLWEGDAPPAVHAPIIVEADRGEDLGRVHAVGELAERRCSGCSHGCGTDSRPTERALRIASAAEVARASTLREENEVARRTTHERTRAAGLGMKISDAEWQWDRRKLTIYFTAEKRVDFRNLVRELAAHFRARIELRQIGVRDEAKRLSGIGRCGREYCSASWLPDLRPVNLGVAKDQRLSLNPTQISGACGRLMCCLRYEHDFYVQSRRRFPKEGRILRTAHGEEKVLAIDIFRDTVTLRGVEGEARVVPLAELRAETEHAGGAALGIGVTASEVVATIDDPLDEHVLLEDAPMSAIDEASPRTAPRITAPSVLDAPLIETPSLENADVDDDGEEDDSDDAPAAGATTADDDAPRRKRRRGRRGGRRARGERPPRDAGTDAPRGPDDTPSASDS